MPSFSFVGKVYTDNKGYQQLLGFYNYSKKYNNCWVEIDINHLEFMDANLSALLLAMVHKLKQSNKLNFFLDFKNLKGDLNVFSRNGLASRLAGKSNNYSDSRQSTIPVELFKVDDVDHFASYIEKELLSHRGLDTVKFVNKDIVKNSYFEIFDNVGIHANTKDPIFACGQYFPFQKEVKFTLVDLGDGFLKKIAEYTRNSENINDAGKAIKWAIDGNSTKKGACGGTGLKGIFKYCLSSGGSMHIISDDCYWELNGKTINSFKLNNHFIGATIHLIFRHL